MGPPRIPGQNQILIPLISMAPCLKQVSTARKYQSEYIKGSQITAENSQNSSSPTANEDLEKHLVHLSNYKRYSEGYFMQNVQNEYIFQKSSFLELSIGVCPTLNSQETTTTSIPMNSKYPISSALQSEEQPSNTGFSNQVIVYCSSKLTYLENKYSPSTVGFVMMGISTILQLIPTLYVKCNPRVDYTIALMMRGLFTMITIALVAKNKKIPLIGFCRQDMRILFTRAILAAVPQLYFYFAVTKLPLSLGYIIFNTGPIFVFLLSVLLFNGSIHSREIIGIIIAVIGMLAVTNPQIFNNLLFNVPEDQALNSVTLPHQHKQFEYAQGIDRLIYTFFFVLVYVGWAYGILIVKKLKEANTYAMNFFVALACFLFGLGSFISRGIEFPELSILDVINLIFIVGFFSFLYQYTFITATFLNTNHGPLSMLNFLSVVEAYIIQIVFFDEIPSLIEVSGSVLVLLGLLKILIH